MNAALKQLSPLDIAAREYVDAYRCIVPYTLSDKAQLAARLDICADMLERDGGSSEALPGQLRSEATVYRRRYERENTAAKTTHARWNAADKALSDLGHPLRDTDDFNSLAELVSCEDLANDLLTVALTAAEGDCL